MYALCTIVVHIGMKIFQLFYIHVIDFFLFFPPIHQVMYGGRAIDDFDRRILNTYMNEYMGDFIFDTFQPFHFYHNEEVDYNIPEIGPKDQYIRKLSYKTTAIASSMGYFPTETNCFICCNQLERCSQLVEIQLKFIC